MECNNSDFIIIYNIIILYIIITYSRGRLFAHVEGAYCNNVAMLQCCKTYF